MRRSFLGRPGSIASDREFIILHGFGDVKLCGEVDSAKLMRWAPGMAYLYCYDPSDYQPTDAERQEAAEAVATIILDGDPLARAAALWGTAFFVAQLEFAEQLEAPAGER